MERRDFGKVVGVGALGVSTFSSTESEASELTIDGLKIPTQQKDVSGPITAVNLSVNGSYKYKTSVTPDRVTLRLEASIQNDYAQLDAISLSNLAPEKSGEYNLKGNMAGRVPGFGHATLQPDKVGDTKRLEVQARVSLSVRDKGRKLEHKTVKDTFIIEVTKTTASVDITLSGSGSVEIITS